jgi:hypothetical protein
LRDEEIRAALFALSWSKPREDCSHQHTTKQFHQSSFEQDRHSLQIGSAVGQVAARLYAIN